jgi:uncharacterized membrane protein YcaP (DUF421 family)
METVLRAAIIYVCVFVILRIAGKRELSGLSAFELVLLVIIGDLVQQGVTQQDTSLTAALLAVSTIVVLMVAMSWATYRFRRAAPVTDGLPVIVVRDGRLQRQAMAVERLTEDEVREAARQQGIADLRDVLVGILETDGKFSFVTGVSRQQQRAEQEPPAA